MRRFLSYCLAVAAGLFLVSCTREVDSQLEEWDGPVISLTLSTLSSSDTKADETYQQAGENPYHENDIKWVDFYFYPDDATSQSATYHKRVVLDQTTRNTATFLLQLTTNQVNYSIFPVHSETTTATVLALANVPQALLDAQDDTSMDALFRLEVNTDFSVKTTQGNHRQSSFMMSGTTSITLKGRTKKEVAQGQIDLCRYACKITVGVKTDEKVELETNILDADNNPVFETWTPCVEEMKVYIESAVKQVALGGNPAGLDGGAKAPSTEAGWTSFTLSYRSNPLYFFEDLGTEAAHDYRLIFDRSNGYYNTYPMYMYPQHWVDGVSEGITQEPYLKLVLPWQRAEVQVNNTVVIKSAKKDFYYKIMIPKDRRAGEFLNSFIRNNWYHYNIDVGMLGADTDDAAVELNPIDFYIYYWQDKNVVIKHAEIGNARYLSVTQETYVLHNEPSVGVRFTTSHPVSFQVNSVTRPYYGKSTSVGSTIAGGKLCKETQDGKLYPKNSYYLSYPEEIRTANGTKEDWFRLEGGQVIMTHTLDNNYSSATFDYSPYTITMDIWHTDQVKTEADKEKTDYIQHVTIEQYPAIYITAEENSDPQVYDPAQGLPLSGDETENAGNAVWRNYAHNGFVFVDGQRRWRHKTNKNDDGEYGTQAKALAKLNNTTWKNDQADAENKQIFQKLEWLQWRTVHFSGGNRNRYTINVSVLPEDSPFIIGDPRTLVPDNYEGGPDNKPGYESSTWDVNYFYWDDANGNKTVDEGEVNDSYSIWFEEAPDSKTGVVRPLSHYYPAENSTRTISMLAPGLRVASRFGGLEFYKGVIQRDAQFKCATYQEDGYPAGRWRLPTKAEIQFIATLTTKSDFVKLFSTGSFYWSANGAYKPGNKNIDTTQSVALVRCVYDAWYWDSYNDRLPEGYEIVDEGGVEKKVYYRDHYVLGDFER